MATALSNKDYFKLISGKFLEEENFGDNKGDSIDILKGVQYYFDDYPDAKLGLI